MPSSDPRRARLRGVCRGHIARDSWEGTGFRELWSAQAQPPVSLRYSEHPSSECGLSTDSLGQKDGRRTTINKQCSLTLRSLGFRGRDGASSPITRIQSRKEEVLQEARVGEAGSL